MNISPKAYRRLVPCLMPLAALYLLWRARKQSDYLKHWGERFAWSDFPQPRPNHPRIWIHAVSVGETNATRPLVQAILKEWPHCDILLTHMTPTGRDAGAKIKALAPERIEQCFLPYDAPYAMEKFLRQTQPRLGIVMETEVWPTVLEEAKRKGIPMLLANARLSEKSFNQAMKAEDLMRDAMSKFSAVCAQSPKDAERLVSIGTKTPEITGSLKFDIQAPRVALEKATYWKAIIGRPIMLLASTRAGEEEVLINELCQTVQSNTLYLLVPRHPQRFDEVEGIVKASGLRYQRRSALECPSDLLADTQVLLGDSMGEMFFYCALADVTMMGGSFKPFGCQNVIEPASVGVPVVVGPSTFNFAQVVEEGKRIGGIFQVENEKEAFAHAHALLDDHQAWQTAHAKAVEFSQAFIGATERTMKVIRTLWKN